MSVDGLGRRLRARLDAVGVEAGAPVVVACSGGLDSTVLLHLLRFAAGQRPDRITVVHFDHGMRPGSAGDAAWVRGLARGWGLAARVGRAGTTPGGETEARDARWAFLEEAAEAVGAVGVLTGHHADDQAETVLHNVVRGAGLRGLAAMEIAAAGRIRPLLPESRATLRSWAEARGLRARTDPTNALPTTARNRIRHEALPLLEEVRPGAASGLVRLARLARREERALVQAEDAWLADRVRSRSAGRIEVETAALEAVAPDFRARLLRRLVREVGGRLDEAGTRAAVQFTTARSGGRVAGLPGGVVLRRSLGVLEVEGPARPTPPDDRELSVGADPARGMGEVVVGGARWSVEWGPDEPDTPLRVGLPLARDRFPLRLRGWRAGDRIRSGEGSAAVARAWSRAGVPRHERLRRPVVEDRRARLLWVPGALRSSDLDADSGTPFYIGIRHVDIV